MTGCRRPLETKLLEFDRTSLRPVALRICKPTAQLALHVSKPINQSVIVDVIPLSHPRGQTAALEAHRAVSVRRFVRHRFWKRLAVVLGSVVFTAGTGVAQVSLPFHDSFAYPEGRLNDVASPRWTAGSTGWELAVSNNPSLTAPEGFPAAAGRSVRRAPSGTARRSVLAHQAVPALDGNELYASLLLKSLGHRPRRSSSPISTTIPAVKVLFSGRTFPDCGGSGRNREEIVHARPYDGGSPCGHAFDRVSLSLSAWKRPGGFMDQPSSLHV